MPRPALGADEIERQRKAVCDAATRLFARHGFEAVTMRAIAAETGRSHTAAYRYFRGRKEIFQLVRAAAFRRFADHLQAAVRNERDPARRARKLLLAYVDFALADPDGYRLMFEMTQGPKDGTPELAAEMARSFSHALDLARSAIQAGLATGEPVTLAHVLWAPVHGVVSLHLAEQLVHGRRLDELVEPLIGFVLGRRPGSTRRPARRRRR